MLKSNQHNWQCVINHLEFRGQKCSIKNLVLAGRCPEAVAPVLFGGRLLALSKKSGGIRPIAIGFTLRRLLPNVPTRLEPTNWLLISTRISWALIPLVDVKAATDSMAASLTFEDCKPPPKLAQTSYHPCNTPMTLPSLHTPATVSSAYLTPHSTLSADVV